jgi:hypothetical protein
VSRPAWERAPRVSLRPRDRRADRRWWWGLSVSLRRRGAGRLRGPGASSAPGAWP